MVLQDNPGRSDAVRAEDDPHQVGDEIELAKQIMGEKPFASPGVLQGFLVVWQPEEYVPVPVHNVEDQQRNLFCM